MKKVSLIILFTASLSVMGQKQLTLEDVIPGGRSFYNFYPAQLNIDFRFNSNQMVVQRQDALYIKGVKDINETLLLKLSTINKKISEAGEKPLHFWPKINWTSINKFWFKSGNKYMTYLLDSSKLTLLAKADEKGKELDFCTENGRVAYCVGDDLFVTSKNGEPVAVGISEKPGVIYGQTVHRSEFGIHKGTYWSPSGGMLAFYRKDESMVSNYPLVNIETRVAKVDNIKYPMAGMTSEEVSIGVFNVQSRSTIYLKTSSPKDRYFTNIAWTPDEKYILVAELNRGQDHMQLNRYNAYTGELVATLFEERDEQWVEPQYPALFVPGSDDMFIWQSVRNGYNHLYLYNIEGKLIRELTKGEVEVTGIIGFDKRGKNLFVHIAEDDALNRYACQISLSNGKMKQIPHAEEGVHQVKVSADGKYVIDTYSSSSVPNKVDLLSVDGKLNKNILTAKNPYEGFDFGKIDLLKIKSADGQTDLNARIILPPDFDPSKKYPVIVYVYGGPHAQMVKNRWLGGARTWQLYMAQKGYIAFTMDNRGTPFRGIDFEQVIHRRLGVPEVTDQMKGIEYLKSLPYVDVSRIGVHGWSYGGYMTVALMLKHAEVFKTGVAGGPVIDWKYYEVMYGERYMDTPEENPEGYDSADLKKQVANLKGRLLLIHGSIDWKVVWQHSLSFVRECVKNEVQVDYFPFPRHEHNVFGRDRIHLMKKVTQYFVDFL